MASHSHQVIHLNSFISIHSFILSFHFISFHVIFILIFIFIFISFSFVLICILISLFIFISFLFISLHFISSHFISCHLNSFISSHSFYFIPFNSFISFRSFHAFHFISFQFTCFQLTKNSYKQSGSYRHVLFSKLPPRRVPGTAWYIHYIHSIYIYIFKLIHIQMYIPMTFLFYLQL